ncbi:MAG: hypothetical protein N2593_03435 [Patescibacteria group bacterium]|nr:hypothetical protein [Patescibacteria group bacterium]
MENIRITKKQIVFTFLFIVISFFIYFLINNLNKNTKIVFCNVGQGDGTYMRIENKIDVLIDAGPDKSILSCLGKHIPFWDKQIEIAFLSHPNKDHYQGFYYINERYKIINFITTESLFVNKKYKELINQLIKNETKIYRYFKNQKININKNIYFYLYWPEKNFTSNNDNDYSQVMIYSQKKFNILFTGDVNIKILNKLIKNKDFIKNRINILKIPHHGSKNGINKKILSTIKPEIAVISVAKKNSYGHPNKEILDMLKALNIKIKRTDIEGDIIFKIN